MKAISHLFSTIVLMSSAQAASPEHTSGLHHIMSAGVVYEGPATHEEIVKFADSKIGEGLPSQRRSFIRMITGLRLAEMPELCRLMTELSKNLYDEYISYDSLASLEADRRLPALRFLKEKMPKYTDSKCDIHDFVDLSKGTRQDQWDDLYKLRDPLLNGLDAKEEGNRWTILGALSCVSPDERLSLGLLAIRLFAPSFDYFQRIQIIYFIQKIPEAERATRVDRVFKNMPRNSSPLERYLIIKDVLRTLLHEDIDPVYRSDLHYTVF